MNTTMLHNTQEQQRQRMVRPRLVHFRLALLVVASCQYTSAFVAQVSPATVRSLRSPHSMWWYGGSEAVEVQPIHQEDSCELVAVRIERTSANSRRILGDIVIPTPIQDVWAILTDYNRLAVHVPNLVESRIEQVQSGGEMGDGQFRCRLFQKGAQKIVGFEFGASVTMDMREMARTRTVPPLRGSVVDERSISFKCTDSFFFQEFDGEWKAKERTNSAGEVETVLSYFVDVRPKGPVPVLALEWRIREDVPTNLRAVKKAALEVGYDGVMDARYGNRRRQSSRTPSHSPLTPKFLKVKWNSDETMEKYLLDS